MLLGNTFVLVMTQMDLPDHEKQASAERCSAPGYTGLHVTVIGQDLHVH